MKNQQILAVAAVAVASMATVQAQTITAWQFDNDYVAPVPPATLDYNASPAASTGSGVAMALGMSNSYNNTNSVSNPDILSSSGSSTGTLQPYAWRVRGAGTGTSAGNGWSSLAPIATQGASFAASTVGYNTINVSVDIDTTAQAERNLAILYTLNDTVGSPTWLNATLTSAGNLGTIANNSSSANTISGNYVQLGSGWNNLITASLPGAQDDANLAVEIVNASTGADCVNISGAALNNTSGNWRYDNAIISGALDTPEPSSLALAGIGLTSLLAYRRSRKA